MSDPRWTRAIELLAEGHSNADVARILDVHRNTVANWQRVPQFSEMLHNRVRQLQTENIRRRMHQMSRAMTKLYRGINGLLDEVALDPSNANASRTMESWVQAYLALLREERIDYEVVQPLRPLT